MFPGLDLHYAGPAQHIITADLDLLKMNDLQYVHRDLSDGCILRRHKRGATLSMRRAASGFIPTVGTSAEGLYVVTSRLDGFHLCAPPPPPTHGEKWHRNIPGICLAFLTAIGGLYVVVCWHRWCTGNHLTLTHIVMQVHVRILSTLSDFRTACGTWLSRYSADGTPLKHGAGRRCKHASYAHLPDKQ